MQINDNNRFVSQSKLIAFIAIFVMLAACSNTKGTISPIPTLSVYQTIFPQNSPTPHNTEIPPTSTATLLPPLETQNGAHNAGLIVFSMGDGEFTHLFAYHPSYLPITRLTSGEWDDDSPAISPDGKQIAYTSSRSGFQDIYLLDLVSNTTTKLTNTSEYEGAICWSPDGQWIAYEVYRDSQFNIMLQSVWDPSTPAIQLTKGAGNNFNPSWSPLGREIAFVTDRSGRNEIWSVELDTARFRKLVGNKSADYDHPTWSPDGLTLAWSRIDTESMIEIWQIQMADFQPNTIGKGSDPIWLPDGSGVLAKIILPNQNNLIAYSVQDGRLLLPPILLPGQIFDYDWKSAQISEDIQTYLSLAFITQPDPLWNTAQSNTISEAGRYKLELLPNVSSPQPYLSDAVGENFNQLRTLTGKKLGWNFLGILENAVLSLTTPPQPGIPQNWLFTGRAIAVNTTPLEADWMSVVREDFNGQTYWRVWMKCLKQDGSCGEPLKTHIWDFDSRFSGDLVSFENGGKMDGIPAGYWVDFTELAGRFNWERLPKESKLRA